jgi:hypothetical protein
MAKLIEQFVVCRAEPRDWTHRQQVMVPLADFPTREEADTYLVDLEGGNRERSFPHEVVRLDAGEPRRFLVLWVPDQIEEWAHKGELETSDDRYYELEAGVGDLVYLIGRAPGGKVALLSRMEILELDGRGNTFLDIPKVEHDRIVPASELFMNLLFWRATAPSTGWGPSAQDAGTGRHEALRRFRRRGGHTLGGAETLPTRYRFLRPALVERSGDELVLGQTTRILSEIARGGEWLDYLMELGPKPQEHVPVEAPSVSLRGRR